MSAFGVPGITKLLLAPFKALSFSFAVKLILSSVCSAVSTSSSSDSFSTMSFNLSRTYSILSIILLYNKEAVLRTLCSLSASASGVAVTGADTALYNLLIVFLIQQVMFIIGF